MNYLSYCDISNWSRTMSCR